MVGMRRGNRGIGGIGRRSMGGIFGFLSRAGKAPGFRMKPKQRKQGGGGNDFFGGGP